MEKAVGTMSIGVRAPIIRKGDNLAEIVVNSVLTASHQLKLNVDDGDVIAVTESVVARAEGNYVTVDDIASDVRSKFGDSKIAVVWPILSRNRFAMVLKGICRGAAGGVLLALSLPGDEVGNHLISDEEWQESSVYAKHIIDEKEFRKEWGHPKHEFTGVDYIEYYKSIAKKEHCKMEIVFTNQAWSIVELCNVKNILCCDIHTRETSKAAFKKFGANKVYGLDEICSTPNIKTGFNSKFGLLGSNKANEEMLKLLPKEPEYLVSMIEFKIYELIGKKVSVLVYGDGAFKDPVGKIWELADPAVAISCSKELKGRPNELKLKALADGKFNELSGEALKQAIVDEIKTKEGDLKGSMASQGTTPRQITDLLGSLADLTSGSGDKGTPIVWIKGYFRNYAD